MDEQPITTRYPRDLLADIKKRAKESGRSFNSEVIHELRQYQVKPTQPENPEQITGEDLQSAELEMEEVWKRYAVK